MALALMRSLCLGQVDSTQERVVKREDGEKLAKVSQNREGGEGILEIVTLGLPAMCPAPSWQ